LSDLLGDSVRAFAVNIERLVAAGRGAAAQPAKGR
jgi:hypothetical protein